jgi:hypothetical protein
MKVCKGTDPAEWETEALIKALGALDDKARTGALSLLAHHLTVEIRILLSDPLCDQRVLDRVRAVNEFEHHLTSRLHPNGLRSGEEDMVLLADIVADAARCGLTRAVKRGIVIAVRNALADTPKAIAAAP